MSRIMKIASISLLITTLLTACTQAIDGFFISLVDRPQEPKERDYIVRQVQFQVEDGVMLAGELTYPKGERPYKALVLVSGYGGYHEPADRNSYLGKLVNHKSFLVLSDLMTKRGYAVLRYDNRGVGQSEGSWQEAADPVYASDAAAALKWLRKQSYVTISNAGYVGHSQGGIKAPMAAKLEKPDFMVLLAGGVESTSELIVNQLLDYAKESKFSQEKTAKLLEQ